MSMTSTVHCEFREPTGINRVAQQLGRALVARGERPVKTVVAQPFDGAQQLVAEQLLNDRALSISNRQTRYF